MTTTADSVNALADILQGCVDGKSAIAEALASKGVPTAADASFDTMAVNVGLIEGGGGMEPFYTGTFVISETKTNTAWADLISVPDAFNAFKLHYSPDVPNDSVQPLMLTVIDLVNGDMVNGCFLSKSFISGVRWSSRNSYVYIIGANGPGAVLSNGIAVTNDLGMYGIKWANSTPALTLQTRCNSYGAQLFVPGTYRIRLYDISQIKYEEVLR